MYQEYSIDLSMNHGRSVHAPCTIFHPELQISQYFNYSHIAGLYRIEKREDEVGGRRRKRRRRERRARGREGERAVRSRWVERAFRRTSKNRGLKFI